MIKERIESIKKRIKSYNKIYENELCIVLSWKTIKEELSKSHKSIYIEDYSIFVKNTKWEIIKSLKKDGKPWKINKIWFYLQKNKIWELSDITQKRLIDFLNIKKEDQVNFECHDFWLFLYQPKVWYKEKWAEIHEDKNLDIEDMLLFKDSYSTSNHRALYIWNDYLVSKARWKNWIYIQTFKNAKKYFKNIWIEKMVYSTKEEPNVKRTSPNKIFNQ